jgi:hypothetical protein
LILSVAQAPTEGASNTHMFGIWSDMIVSGERPPGLVNAYLLEGDGTIHVHTIWESREAHDRAMAKAPNHAVFGFFAACGLDPAQSVFRVIGRI